MYLFAIKDFLNTKGRLNRLQFLLVWLFLCALIHMFSTVQNDLFISCLYALAIIPSQIKRLHDINLSGYVAIVWIFYFINLIFFGHNASILSLITFIYMMILIFYPGIKKENQYGQEPHLIHTGKKRTFLLFFMIFFIFFLGEISHDFLSELNFQKGRIESSKGNYSNAISHFDKSLKFSPEASSKHKVYSFRGHAKEKLKKYEEALQDFDKAIELYNKKRKKDIKTLYVYYSQRILTNEALEKYTEAIADSKKLLELDIDNNLKSAIYFELGEISSKIGNQEEALSYYNKALENGLSNSEIYLNLGYIHYEKHNLLEAMNYLSKAIELNNKKYPKAYFRRGIIKVILMNCPSAMVDFNQATKLGFSDKNLYLMQGFCKRVSKNYKGFAEDTLKAAMYEQRFQEYKTRQILSGEKQESDFNITADDIIVNSFLEFINEVSSNNQGDSLKQESINYN